jgi:hypothetical protein
MAEDVVPQIDDLLGLCEIGHAALVVDAASIEPSACLAVRPSADEDVPYPIPGNWAAVLLDAALDDPSAPGVEQLGLGLASLAIDSRQVGVPHELVVVLALGEVGGGDLVEHEGERGIVLI